MSFNKNQLKDATAFLREAYGSAIPSTPETPLYSPSFLRKMEGLQRRYRIRKALKMLTKSAAVLLALLALIGGLYLGFHIEARAAVRSWFRSLTGKRYSYHFSEDRRGEELPPYEITALPNGYSLVKSNCTSSNHMLRYQKSNGGGRYITPLSLEYFWISERIHVTYTEDGFHRLTSKSVTINGLPADLYESHQNLEDWTSRRLLWVDETTGIMFCLQGRLTEEELIVVAESIAPAKQY